MDSDDNGGNAGDDNISWGGSNTCRKLNGVGGPDTAGGAILEGVLVVATPCLGPFVIRFVAARGVVGKQPIGPP